MEAVLAAKYWGVVLGALGLGWLGLVLLVLIIVLVLFWLL